MEEERGRPSEGGTRTGTFAGSGTSVADTARARGTSAGKRESGIEGTGRESRDPHPADSYNFNHQLATLLPPRGRVICEKHVDLRVEEGRLYSFISSYISCKRLSLLLRRCSTYTLVGEKRTSVIHALNFIDPRDNVCLRPYINRFVRVKFFQRCFLKWERSKKEYNYLRLSLGYISVYAKSAKSCAYFSLV